MTVSLPRVSSEQLYVVGVKAFADDVASDPTLFDVEFAFTRPDVRPGDVDFNDGQWLDGGPPYTAWILVVGEGSPNANGPGVTLAAGSYDIWLRVVGASNTPTRRVDNLKVT